MQELQTSAMQNIVSMRCEALNLTGSIVRMCIHTCTREQRRPMREEMTGGSLYANIYVYMLDLL